ncbi:MAG: hypothetical protein Q7K43_04980 [Candidatus Woesearchaeota archaeon]|nr:hypothetical protein [Candidatus Woesearchaeota archaeon]
MAKTELSDYVPQEFLSECFERKGAAETHEFISSFFTTIYRSNVPNATLDVVVLSVVRDGNAEHSDRQDWYVGTCDAGIAQDSELFIDTAKKVYSRRNRTAGKELFNKIKELLGQKQI